MSSIIVLDSSDEDETPSKKASFKSMPDCEISSTSSNPRLNCSKQRSLPSGITITPHNNIGTHVTKPLSSSAMQLLQTSPLLSTNINQAITNLMNRERQTPTPPKSTTILGVPPQRKRKQPTSPPTSMRLAPKSFANMNASGIMSPAAAATTMAPLPPIMPMITGVHSMAAAGATPPLQLMATPPHILGNMATSLNEQMMLNPSLLQSNLPPNTTITPHSNTNPNQNNINNNFKIHLPPKPLTPSPAASPAAPTPESTSPQLATSTYKGRTEKASKRVKLTTILKSTDDAWLQQRPKAMVQSDDLYHSNQSCNNKDVSWEIPSPDSSKSSSRQQTPIASPSIPKVYKSPDISVQLTPITDKVFDLTTSPDKTFVPSAVEIPCKNSVNTSPEKQVNGGTSNTAKFSKEDQKPKTSAKPPLEPEFEELINVCKTADPSLDMNKLIKTKLIKYYYEVHGDFVKSKSFRKSIRKVIAAIRAEPDLVYYNLTTIVEELKVRRKAKVVELPTVVSPKNEDNSGADTSTETEKINDSLNDVKPALVTIATEACSSASPRIPIASTGNKKLDEQIKKLNKALHVLTKRIEVLEQAEVDWDDDDSSFLQVERFKKRACQIYEKICDLTGESKNAHRLVKKPIKFNETRIPQFNKTLQAFINRTKEFPDYYDVLRMLEHCNRTYSLGLVNFEIKNIAEDAFIKVGKLLQSRRKADLYETVTHYGGREKDPAQNDPLLAAKLNENLKSCRKISDILEKFARKQDMPEEEEEEDNKAENIKICGQIVKSSPCRDEGETTTSAVSKADTGKPETKGTFNTTQEVESDDDEDDDDEDEDADLEEHVEKLANGEESENESENENSAKDDRKNNFTVVDNPVTEQSEANDMLTIDTTIGETEVPKSVDPRESPQVITIDCADNDASHAESINNNNNLDRSEKKTALSEIARKCTTPPSNGKVKEPSKINAYNPNPVTAMSLANATADVRIVTVSSHKAGEILSANSNDCSSKLFSEPNNKSLEEIVISDEES